MKVYTREEYDQLMNGFWKKIALVIAGAVACAAFGSFGGAACSVGFAVMFAGVPYAWAKVPFVALGIWSLLIKVLFAVILGWIVTPYALAVDISGIISYKIANKESENGFVDE